MILINNLSCEQFYNSIRDRDVFVDYVSEYFGIRAVCNGVILIFIKKVTEPNETYVINLGHQDTLSSAVGMNNSINSIIKSARNTFVVDKKRFCHAFADKELNVNDLKLVKFQNDVSIADEEEFFTNYHLISNHQSKSHLSNFNYIIPLSKHIETFNKKYEYYKECINLFHPDLSFKYSNGIITETLCQIESNGLYVDEWEFKKHFSDKNVTPFHGKVYTEYNLFTSTGRPSNSFGGINYAALNKKTGCRKSFVSRFGDNGMLMTIDYSAYHPHIIANLIHYTLDLKDNIYDYLGRYYFNQAEKLTPEQIIKSKSITFQNLYGGIKDRHKHIPYFQKTDEYINHRWEFFKKNGYVETPVFKRRITDKHIVDPSPNKLFNYILQAAETEFSIQNISRVNEYLKDKQSVVVLYTYDSILIDICAGDGKETLQEIKRIMVDNQFPVKCYVGKNYDNMTLINL